MKRLLLPLLLCASSALAQTFAVDPHSSVDLITQVNALALGCNFACTVRIPAGEYTVATGTILVHHNALSIVGDGRNNTIIHYAGLNFLDSRLDAATYGPSYSGSGLIGGFTVYCTNPNVHCITTGSVLGQRWQDITLVGPGTLTGSPPVGAHAEAFTIQNTYNWMERTVFRDLTLGGFSSNFHFLAPTPGGTNSFGYMLFDGIWTNQGPRSHNFVVDPGAAVYNTLGFTMQVNSGATSTQDEVFSISGEFSGVGFHVTGENAGAPITFAHVHCNARMNFEGDYNVFFGEAISDCPQGKRDTGAQFRIGPNSGLAGIRGSMAGNPTLANTTALGQISAQDLVIWPYEDFNRSNPYAIAYTGFAAGRSGVSPISVFDPNVPWCVATRGLYTGEGQIDPKLCLNGAGELAAAQSFRAPTIRTTRGTPANSHEACTPGDSWDDDNFHYHCTSTKQIKRIPLSTF